MTVAAFHEEWFHTASQDAVADLVRQVADIPGAIVEIGAWEGRSTCAIANAAWPRIVDTCDTWDGSNHEISEAIAKTRDVYGQWTANVAEHTKGNVVAHRMDWRDYVPTIDGPVAFCFIDAGHSYREVFDNVAAIIPMLAPGAILCGDDAHHGPVRDAIIDLFDITDVTITASLWVWRMPDTAAAADVARLRARDLRLAPTDHEFAVDLDKIHRVWASYVSSVSVPGHAAGPGAVAYLYRLCDYLRPASILDLGSGLSSVVFRKWATERGVDCAITSVDTDAEWLEKTRTFLKDDELPTDGLNLWPIDIEPEAFDLVFHDLAGGELRSQVAPIAAAAVKRGGCIVFDDAQHAGHLSAYESASKSHGIELYSLAKWTFDAIERWAVIGFRDGDPVVDDLAELHAVNCSTPSDINQHLPMLATMGSNAQHVVELGARSGLSTVAWLMGLRKSGGRLTSVDISPAPQIGTQANWEHIQGDDTDADVMARVDGCDILFIDTSHHFEHTLWELRNWSGKVRDGGIIVCHDTELERPWDPPCPETDPDFPVRAAIEQFCAETGYRWINVPGCWGLGIIEVRAT